MRLIWAPEARADRDDIWLYIARDNEDAAQRMDDLFSDAAARLCDFPYLGRVGDAPGTRELFPHPSYRLVYRVEGDTISIITLVHTARQWPPLNESR